MGQEGHEHLKILRKFATGSLSLYCDNHALPMFSELQFEDIIFGVFPKAGGTVLEAHGYWPRNSVGDILDMLLRLLEVIVLLLDANVPIDAILRLLYLSIHIMSLIE